MRVRVRKFSRKAQADGGKLCLRFVETGAGREASEHVDLWSLTPLELSQIQPERNPCIVGNREPETLRHDTNYGYRRGSQVYILPNNRGIAAKTRPPDVIR